MNHTAMILLLAFAPPLVALAETADEVARRVIADTSSAYTPVEPVLSLPPERSPEDDRLAEAAKKSQKVVREFMLSDATPEKTRIAYAIGVLAAKRVSRGMRVSVLGEFDTKKNDQYLIDARVLSARLAEIERAELKDK